ncbi:MAG: C-terminal binding protein [Synergistaceae bacterium]|nr:C-terminal binding protein [Synergistaceae bacterium]
MKKIVLSSVLVENPDIESALIGERGYELIFIPNSDDDTFLDKIKFADAVITADKQITKEMIDTMENCQIIVRQGIGFDSIDLKAARQKGIVVCNIPDYCVEEVADYTVGMILAATRHITTYNQHVHEGIWDINSVHKVSGFPPIRRLSTQTVGIVGFGRIARLIASRLRPFGANLITYDPYIDSKIAEENGAKLVGFDELVKTADIMTLNLPLTEETYHMFDKDAFEKMKETAFVINTGRGPLINEKDLDYALRNGLIAGASIDVTESEPLTLDSPLLELKNLVITPHAAFFSHDSFIELREKAAAEAMGVLDGEAPKNPVNL